MGDNLMRLAGLSSGNTERFEIWEVSEKVCLVIAEGCDAAGGILENASGDLEDGSWCTMERL